jgi:hypothetical protein
MTVIQEIAGTAGVTLELSSGLRIGDKGNHSTGRAIDIKAINGVDIGSGSLTNPAVAALVRKVQATAKAHPDVRENFGPAGLWKSARRGEEQLNFNDGSAKRRMLQQHHMNHIHISIQL